ncbi:OmpH family outer membrane protein [bacterium]|nr:OmpH family outer membrane protein [bacterium]
MIRRILPCIITALALAVIVSGSVYAQEQLKIAFVRTGYIMSNYEPYRVAMKTFRDFETAETEKLQKKGELFQQKVADSQKQAAFMDEQKIAQRRDELERENATLQDEYDKLHNRDTGILVTRYNELVKPVFDTVDNVIKKIRTDEGIAFIFEAESEVLIDADPKYDISDKVIAALAKLQPPAAVKK